MQRLLNKGDGETINDEEMEGLFGHDGSQFKSKVTEATPLPLPR